jgi:hypothetical protein
MPRLSGMTIILPSLMLWSSMFPAILQNQVCFKSYM